MFVSQSRTESVGPLTNLPQFRLDVLTHRRTILDSAKLEYLNKHHLVRTRSSESGLQALALRGQGYVKDAFPHTSVCHFRPFGVFLNKSHVILGRSPQSNTLRRLSLFFRAAWSLSWTCLRPRPISSCRRPGQMRKRVRCSMGSHWKTIKMRCVVQRNALNSHHHSGIHRHWQTPCTLRAEQRR